MGNISLDDILEEMIRSEETGENRETRETQDDNENHLPKVIHALDNNIEVRDFDLYKIINYGYENGYLYLLYKVKSRETIPISFEKLKQNFPLETV